MTGDPSLDEELKDEAELKSRMADLLDESELAMVVAFLLPWLDDAALSSAAWRLDRMVGSPYRRAEDTAPPLVQLILAHAQTAVDAESFGNGVVGLLVESINSKTTSRILRTLQGRPI